MPYMQSYYKNTITTLLKYSEVELKKIYSMREKILKKNKEESFELTDNLEPFLMMCYQSKILMESKTFEQEANTFQLLPPTAHECYEMLANFASYLDISGLHSHASEYHKIFQDICLLQKHLESTISDFLSKNSSDWRVIIPLKNLLNDMESYKKLGISVSKSRMGQNINGPDVSKSFDSIMSNFLIYVILKLSYNCSIGYHVYCYETFNAMESVGINVSELRKICDEIAKLHDKFLQKENRINTISQQQLSLKQSEIIEDVLEELL